MTRTALIGCGDISVMHLSAIEANPDIELVAVCDTDSGRLAATSEKAGVRPFSDPEALLAELGGELDVVHVATPHESHAPIAELFLGAGIDVLTEKPVAASLAAAEHLVTAADASSARIAVCFQNRYNAPVQALRKLLDGGTLGAVLGATASLAWHRTQAYYENRPWRASWAGGGGGLLLNQAIHTIDLLQWLLGEPVAVHGHASTRALPMEVEDTTEAIFDHGGGVRSCFYATVAYARDKPVEIEIVTEQAVLRLAGALTITHTDGRVETVDEVRPDGKGRSYWGASHGLLINDFHAGHGSGEPFWIDAAEASKAIKVIDAIYRESAIGPYAA